MTSQTTESHYPSPNIQQQKRYDAAEIARYYRSRPWEVIQRAATIIWSFGWFLLHLQWDNWFNPDQDNKQKCATKLRLILTCLGPTFIKVGQALSTRPDLIRPDFLEELIKLQDQLPPFDNKIAFSIIFITLLATIQPALLSTKNLSLQS